MMQMIKSETLNCEVNYILDESNEPWFSGKSIATTLGYKDSKHAIRDNVDEEDRKKLGLLRPSKKDGLKLEDFRGVPGPP